jgi:hypothetical protein
MSIHSDFLDNTASVSDCRPVEPRPAEIRWSRRKTILVSLGSSLVLWIGLIMLIRYLLSL